jgi:flagellar protein FliO/FliZ
MSKSVLLNAAFTLAIVCSSVLSAFAASESEEEPMAAKLTVGSQLPAADSVGEATRDATRDASKEPEVAATQVPIASETHPGALPKVETTKLQENEIPVLAGNKDTKKTTSSGFSRFMITLGVLAVLLGATLFGLRRFGKRRDSQNHNARIRVLTQYSLGPKKSLSIVQVAGETILLGVTDHNISMLKTLALIDDEFPDEMPRKFNTALDDLGEEERESREHVTSGAHELDDFAVRGLSEIRDKVSTRLRNMKNL